ncbi:MAG: hypothetical protein P4L81_07975, partial [Candidatus Pacebacteria bacterium]|nr:hypothetical protein [Candidatus Paceibacterota bacterium]
MSTQRAVHRLVRAQQCSGVPQQPQQRAFCFYSAAAAAAAAAPNHAASLSHLTATPAAHSPFASIRRIGSAGPSLARSFHSASL